MGIRIFANDNNMATITCPECGSTVCKDVSKFMGHKTLVCLKYTCKCKHQFSVNLERRRSIRKSVFFKGVVIGKTDQKTPITITDISKHGLKITFLQKPCYQTGDTIQIRFKLDDSNQSSVTKRVRLKRFLSPVSAGCEFLEIEHFDNLGKYFLFNF